MTNKKNNSILGVLAVIAVIIVGAAYMGGYLSFALNPLPLPSSVYSGLTAEQCTTSGTYVCTSASYITGTTSYASTINNSYVYSLTSYSGYGTGCQGCVSFQAWGPASAYIATNYSGVAYANAQNNANFASANSSALSALQQATYDGQHGECASTISPCLSEEVYAQAIQNYQAVLTAANVHNNAIPKPITTTTTIPVTVTPSLPTNPLTAFWNGLTALWNKIIAFLVAPLQLSVATSQNFTVSAPFTTQVSLMIPAQWQTMNMSMASGKTVQQTFCGTFVLNNQSAVLQSSTPTITYGSYYNNTFSYTPSTRQILVVGGLCRTDSIQYSVVSGTWGSWSAWNTTVNQSAIAKAGITTVTPNQVTAFFTGVFTWINNFLKSLGL